MSALDELAIACERRGLRLLLTGLSRDGVNQPGMLLDGLEVRARDRSVLIAQVPVDGLADDLRLDVAAVDLAREVVRATSS